MNHPERTTPSDPQAPEGPAHETRPQIPEGETRSQIPEEETRFRPEDDSRLPEGETRPQIPEGDPRLPEDDPRFPEDGPRPQTPEDETGWWIPDGPEDEARSRVTEGPESGNRCRLPEGIIREVLGAPHPLLSVSAEPVDPADPAVVAAAADLLATLRHEPSTTGLAAPQIGLRWRLIAFDAGLHPRSRSWAGELVLVNPRLTRASHWDDGREGCASIPGLMADVRRATRITVRGHLPGTGEPVTIEADAFEARCIQHQLDHLDGLLFLDRVPGALSLHRRLHSCDA